LFSGTQQLEKAKLHLGKAIEIEPDFYEAYYALGLVCMRTGEPEQGRSYLALFEQKRQVAKEQSILGAGLMSEGRQ
jgi:Tfp pilus assembly protein PilF